VDLPAAVFGPPLPSLPKAVVYGIASAVALCLGKGLQKYGVPALAHPRAWSRDKALLFKLFIWCLGTAGIVASALLLFTALAYGPVALVAALSGTGLIALAFFSAFALKEKVTKHEVIGIALIVAGTTLAGYFEKYDRLASYGIADNSGQSVALGSLLAFSLAVVAASAAGAIYSIKNDYRLFGPIFGSISGFCGGISVFYQKGAMMFCGCQQIFADIPAVLRNPYFYLFVVTGLADFAVTQYALTQAKAVTVVPCYQSFYIVIPVIGGILAYYERVNIVQVAGMALLLWGVVLLSRRLAGEE